MRCYVPGASTLMILIAAGYLLLHRAASAAFAATGLITGLVAATAGLTAALIAVAATAAVIRRRRAAAGACTTCRFRCQQALPRPSRALVTVRRPVLAARYDRDAAAPAARWPHQPLTRGAQIPGTQAPGTQAPGTQAPGRGSAAAAGPRVPVRATVLRLADPACPPARAATGPPAQPARPASRPAVRAARQGVPDVVRPPALTVLPGPEETLGAGDANCCRLGMC